MDIATHIRTFTVVVHCGGFADAARQLGVVPSVVAKRISQLEAKLQTRLFERTTRRVTLTEAGEKFHSRAAAVVSEMEELFESVRRDDGLPEGHLRVMAPTTLTLLQLGPVFSSFLVAHPGITMQLSLVDLSANPAEGGFDMAISGRAASYEGVVDLPLCPVKPVLCASAAYLQSNKNPTHPRDLVDADCLVFSATGTSWSFQGPRGALAVDVKTRLQADDNLTLLHAAEAGLGIAQLPAYIVEHSIRKGKLEVVMPEFAPQENWFKAYVPRRKMGMARVQALLAHLQKNWSSMQPKT